MNNSTNTAFPAWARSFAIGTAVVYFVSLMFPIIACLIKDPLVTFPKWVGPVDVALAFILAILAFTVQGLARGKVTKPIEETSYRAYRVLNHAILILLLVFFIAGDRITWINGLPGIAWRGWLLLYILPEWFAIVGKSASQESMYDKQN